MPASVSTTLCQWQLPPLVGKSLCVSVCQGLSWPWRIQCIGSAYNRQLTNKSSHRLKILENEWLAACRGNDFEWPPHPSCLMEHSGGRAYTGCFILECIEKEALRVVLHPRDEMVLHLPARCYFRFLFKAMGRLQKACMGRARKSFGNHTPWKSNKRRWRVECRSRKKAIRTVSCSRKRGGSKTSEWTRKPKAKSSSLSILKIVDLIGVRLWRISSRRLWTSHPYNKAFPTSVCYMRKKKWNASVNPSKLVFISGLQPKR